MSRNVRGFWRDSEARATKGNQHFDVPAPKLPVPTAPAGRFDPYTAPRETWRDHPDREAVARALKSTCSKSQESKQ